MMLFYDYFMVYGTNTIGDHDGVESFFPSRIVSGGMSRKTILLQKPYGPG